MSEETVLVYISKRVDALEEEVEKIKTDVEDIKEIVVKMLDVVYGIRNCAAKQSEE